MSGTGHKPSENMDQTLVVNPTIPTPMSNYKCMHMSPVSVPGTAQNVHRRIRTAKDTQGMRAVFLVTRSQLLRAVF